MSSPRRPAAQSTVVVGSKRFTESYILGEILARDRGAHGGAGRAQARARQHRHRVRRAEVGRDRRLPRVHRHDRARDPQARRQSRARRDQPAARADGLRRRRAARLQQHLRARDARRPGGEARHPHALRPRAAPRAEARALAGVHRPRRRLARTQARVRPAARDAVRTRPRPRLRGDRRGADRRDGHLLDRREDRALRDCGCSRTTAGYFPHYDAVLLYRRDLPQRAPAGVAGARRARREDRRAPHDPAERGGRAGGPDVRSRRRRRSSMPVPAPRHAPREARSSRRACSDRISWRLTREHLLLVARLACARDRDRRPARRSRVQGARRRTADPRRGRRDPDDARRSRCSRS